MIIKDKKILITGGGSGIGFSIATALVADGAHVILAGRNEAKLKTSSASLKNASYIVADVSNRDDAKRLFETVQKQHGGIDILINNAGVSKMLCASLGEGFYAKAKEEFEINFFGPLNLIDLFLPELKKKENTAIVNVASVLAYVPTIFAATYSASKAALHSYSVSLRLELETGGSGVKIFEVFPPLVETDMTAGLNAPKIAPEVIANDLVAALKADNYAVRSGVTQYVYEASLASPENALQIINSQL